MDIMLERILSLIPKKPDGKYEHGAKKQFAESIGYSGGEIISMWEKGDSKSYQGKIHEIASVHNVSIAWLRGETDEKKLPALGGELSEEETALIELFRRVPPEQRKAMLQAIEMTLRSQGLL